jgi:hypothetical protein
MSSLDGDQPKAEGELKGEPGAAPSPPSPIKEASREEIDAFVKRALGLIKEEK